MIALIPLVVALVGLLMWLLAGNATVKEIGRILFIIGVLWTVFGYAGQTTKIF